MFFLIRSIFWLGLVFLNMNWHLDQGLASASGAAKPLARQTAGNAGAWCSNHIQACTNALMMAAAIGQNTAPVQVVPATDTRPVATAATQASGRTNKKK